MLREIIRRIKKGRVSVFSGAGMSQESGIPTFRGKGGLWERYDPQVVATLPYVFYTLRDKPSVILHFIREFYSILLKSRPNPAHLFFAHLKEVTGIVTQNIDNLHQEAGSKNVIELHGNAYRFICRRCQRLKIKTKEEIRRFLQESERFSSFSRKVILREIFYFLGRCQCGKFRLPDIVFFGQPLDREILDKAYRVIEESLTLFSIGTSNLVYPAADLPFYAREKGVYIIEVNPRPSGSEFLADIVVREPAGSFFLKLEKLLSG